MTARAETIEISNASALPSNPLVSVYMLAFRHEKFIAKAIEGVILQKCDFPIELIIGEDCSPDDTGEIVSHYQRRYPHLIRLLTSKQNVGAYANGHRCRAACRGKYIAICEGDDYWHHPNKLQMQVNLLSANGNMVLCHTDYDRKTRLHTRRNIHKQNPSPWLARGEAYVALLHEWSVMTATTMFRRDVVTSFEGTAFDNPSWPFGDYNRLLFASLKGHFGYIDQSTATFRKVRDSAGNSGDQAHLKMKIAAEECVEMFLARYPIDAETTRNVRANLKRKTYSAAFYAGRADLMQSAYAWLKDSGFRPNSVAHRMRMSAVKERIPLQLLKAVRNYASTYLSAIPR